MAQPSMAVPLLSAINVKLSVIKQGYFDSNYLWKDATENDTSSGSGRIYFFKDESEKDSICRFVILRANTIYEAYDGTNMYYVNNEEKIVSFRPASQRGGIAKLTDGGVRGKLAFRPYILKKQGFKLSKFTNALIDTFNITNCKALRITLCDSFKNPLKLTDSDLDMMQVRTSYEISLLDTTLLRFREVITFMSSPQIIQTDLSPIVALPDSINFEKVFNLPFLVSSGYKLIDLSKQSAVVKPPMISVGDTIPRFRLMNFDGQEIFSDNILDSLILFDFWYKSCAPCLMAMPLIEHLHQKYQGYGLKVWGVNGHDKDPGDIKSFLHTREVTYSSLIDPSKSLAEKMHITAYPTIILVDPKSRKVLFVHSGFSAEAESKVSDLIEERLIKH